MHDVVQKILIVDDEEEISSLIAYLVQAEMKAELTLLHNGEEAIQEIKKVKFDLIICDYSMPRNNGYAVLCANHELDKTPFIMLTGGFPENYPELVLAKKLHPEIMIITKPFVPENFFQKIKEILKLSDKVAY